MFSAKALRAILPRYSTSPTLTSKPRPIAFIESLFNGATGPRDSLIQDIVSNHYHAARQNGYKTKQVLPVIKDIPHDLSLPEKIGYVKKLLHDYPASPVLTAHPTRVLSNDVIYIIDNMVSRLMAWNQCKGMSLEKQTLERQLKEDIDYLRQHALLPISNLTPQQEADFANYIYVKILDTYPTFLNRFVETFVAVHGGDAKEVKEQLKPSIQRSFKEIGSWAIADCDGNPNKTAKTMDKTVSREQSHIMDLYLERLKPLKDHSKKLQAAYDYLERCKKAMADDIAFDVNGGINAQKRFIRLLDAEIASNTYSKEHQEQLTALRDLVDLAGFWGGLKEFVRQSSLVNRNIFENFFQILADHHPEIQKRMQNNGGDIRRYSELSVSEQEGLLRCLQLDSTYFATLKQQSSLFTPETQNELERLNWILKHRDIFTSYITSDTIGMVTLKEVVILFGFAAYTTGSLHIDDVQQSPINLLPLCETPKDLAQLETIIAAMLHDPYLRALIAREGKLSFVAGPSDLGKVGSIFTLVELVMAAKKAKECLTRFKTVYPELHSVELSILWGLGCDSDRRSSTALHQLHSTFQGTDAHVLSRWGSYESYLHNVIGRPSENTRRAEEFSVLETEYPTEFNALLTLVTQSVKAYQDFSQQPSCKALLKALTVPELGPWMNISSRSEAKGKTQKEITDSRAIGLVNYYLLAGVRWNTFMGAAKLIELYPDIKQHLPLLFAKSTVIQEIVYKIIYAIAVSDIPRAWEKIQRKEPSFEQIQQWALEYTDKKELHHTLAYIHLCSYELLNIMVSFFPVDLQLQAALYFEENTSTLHKKPSHQVALELLEYLGRTDDKLRKLAAEIRYDLLPRYKRLATCIDTYLQDKTAHNAENVVLACRGDERITDGPVEISSITRSPTPSTRKQVIFDEETVPSRGFGLG